METIARPYARAIFGVAQEEQSSDYWLQLLQAVTELLKVDELANLLKDPTQSAQDKHAILLKALSAIDMEVKEEAKNLLFMLIERRRIDVLPVIKELFFQMQQELGNQLEVKVATAYELTEEDKTKLIASLGKLTGKEVNLVETLDKSLIGGVVVEWQGKTLDNSIRGKLEKLSTSL